MTLKSIFLTSLLLLVLFACGNDPLDIDTSNVQIDISYVDMDEAFRTSDSTTLVKVVNDYKNEIKDVYEYEFGHCLNIGDVSDSSVFGAVSDFLADKYIKRLEQRIASQFKNKAAIQTKISGGFTYLKAHFPKEKYPEHVVFLNSLFRSSAASFESDVAVGLEQYLGPKTDVIQELPTNEYYQWYKDGMEVKFLERDVLASWISANHLPTPKSGSLAELMIYWGKVIYFVEASFPQVDKEIIIRYAKVDYEWALKNESSYWQYLVDQKLLFVLDERTKANMLQEGPFTPGLPEKGPDRLGQFLGWRMVQQYMANHSDLPLSELKNIGYNDILQEYETTD
ncbi:MAG: hypothetical protein HRT58_20230 [Crocinitomicaceae bacterium]|nr:hypothetical protein [Flavobacteriales bacterium]NQZ37999.1 hypothetical protein [Crocinitomicaceae bacterium]